MLKYIKIFIALLIFIFPLYDLFGAGYVCYDVMQFTRCNSGYYMAQSRTDTTCNPTPQAGNACLQCPQGYKCAGEKNCPEKINGIIFDLNGGDGTTPDLIENITTGETYQLPTGDTTSYYRAGYVFKGWSTSSSATTGNTSYTVPTDSNDSIILYAVWSACNTGTYKPHTQKANAACLTPDTGYYANSCLNQGMACKEQTQCNGFEYCDGGLLKRCPTKTSNWTEGTGTGWSSITECYQTINATSISQYCTAGTITQHALSNGTWGPSEMSGVKATEGAFVDNTNKTCSQCSGAVWSAGGTATSCTACPQKTSGWTLGTGTGWKSRTQCYQQKTQLANCNAGSLKQYGDKDENKWNDIILMGTPLSANAGSYVSGSSCVICEEGYWCAGGTAPKEPCPEGTGSPAGSASKEACTGDCTNITDNTVCLGIPGCAYTELKKCYDCPAGFYCPGDGQGALDCPESHPNSEEGSEEKTQCYAECEESSEIVKNGSVKPDSKTVNYDKQCEYTNWKNSNYVTCNNQDDICNGYHFNEKGPTNVDNACISNKQSCTPSEDYTSSGIHFWSTSAGKYGKCYITGCKDAYHGRPEGSSTQCETTVYPACDQDTFPCYFELGNCVCSNNTTDPTKDCIKGSIDWDFDNKEYDYSDCKCGIEGQQAGSCGTRNASCDYVSGKNDDTVWDCTYNAIACDSGCCMTESIPDECHSAPKGYYGPDTDKYSCIACPAGSTTTNAGAQNINACTITGGSSGTKFCDNNGCFYLPSGVNIPY